MESQHGVNHLTESPDIRPKDPKIHINVMNLQDGLTGIEWDVRSCESFLEDHGRWLRLCPGQELPR